MCCAACLALVGEPLRHARQFIVPFQLLHVAKKGFLVLI
jgi:hypothetical protein